jgi:hypothetical protein
MGMLNAALRDPLSINHINPASSNALQLTTLDMMGRVSFVDLSSEGQPTVSQSTGGFNYFAFGVPVSENYGFTTGFLPYTAIGYRNTEVIDVPNVGDTRHTYSAQGGLNKAFLNQSVKLFGRLNLGLQLAYYFGTSQNQQDVRFDDPSLLSSRFLRTYNVSDFNIGYGFQYEQPFGEWSELVIGGYSEQTSRLNVSYDEYAYTFTPVASQGIPRDTLIALDAEGQWLLPNQMGFGLTYRRKHPDIMQAAWVVGVDVRIADWSNFETFEGVDQNLSNDLGVSVGGEFLPRYAFKSLERNRSYLSRIQYRLGAFYNQTSITIDEQRIDVRGMTFGLGLPLRVRSLAPGELRYNVLNIGVNYAVRGTLNDGLIREEIIQLTFGVTLNDRWFIKYKYR